MAGDKKRSRGLISALVAAALLLSVCALCLAACCKKDEDDDGAAARAAAGDSFASAALSAADDGWRPEMSDTQLAGLATPGDYLTARVWTRFVADFLVASELQTAKIEKLASVLAGEEGKAFVRDPKSSPDKLIPLLTSVGMTAGDVASLFYDGLTALVDGVPDVLRKCSEALKETRGNNLITGAARDDLNAAVYSAESSLAALGEDYDAAKAELKGLLERAENELKGLATFAYRTALLFGDNGVADLLGSISSGALADITDSEMLVYLDSIESSVNELSAVLGADGISSLGAAIDGILDTFDEVFFASDSAEIILKTMRSVKTFLPALPAACETAVAGLKAVKVRDESGEYSFIRDLKLITAQSETAARKNSSILYARMLMSALEGKSASDVKGLLATVLPSEPEYDDRIVLFYICIAINKLEENPRFIDPDSYVEIVKIPVGEALLNSFKSAYRSYAAGNDNADRLVMLASSLIGYSGLQGVGAADEKTPQWYRAICDATAAKLDAEVNRYADEVSACIEDYVDYFFERQIEDVRALAALDIAAEDDPAAMALIDARLDALNLGGVFS